ncbi:MULTISPECIES: hypothetical protein [unclassified Streptomyces]|uniref:hypothetical protein n=1 Tax=unclassified Streptomyces TaxID=2593676 RepID=UPI000DC78C8B|nr:MULTISPECIES: hypothetical protein [unclassified Streptomyces]AWZ03917.1 hypothetical protein DRB89_03890 [Streptomyces sp. ICC4]AWZ17296.1 hypothetical protein DRB96_40005 [Streptomyces sp. ICC1]
MKMSTHPVPVAAAAVVVLACAVSASASPASASPASATPRYTCSSGTKSIDDAGYSGPWPDNWEVTVSVCAARSGATVYAYADIRWDGPAFYSTTDATIFDGAKARVQIKRSREGTDPVVAEKDFPELEERMEKATSNGDRNGSYRTPTIRHRAGPGALGDAVLYLDWHEDGHGYRGYDYTGSPSV